MKWLVDAILGAAFSGLNEFIAGWRRDRALKKEGALTAALASKEEALKHAQEAADIRGRINADDAYRERMRRRIRDRFK